MLRKLKFSSLLLLTIYLIISCSKHDNPAPPPVITPEVLDTLGAGWQRIIVDTTSQLEDIFFVDNQTGFVCGTNYAGKTTDGGLTWKQTLPSSLNEGLTNIFFVDANNGWITGSSFLIRTKDAGSTWQKAYGGHTFDVQFFDANNGYACFESSSETKGLYKTSDGGMTFQGPGLYGPLTGIYFQDPDKGWFVGTSLRKTENAGVSATQLAAGFNHPYAIQFVDANNGWIAGNGNLYRTIDGGATVITMIAGTGTGDIQFFDANNGFVMTGSAIYSTTDGGKTLNALCKIHKSTLIEFHFTDQSHGWAVGSNGYIYRYVKP